MSAVFDVAPEHLVARARLELLFDSGTFRPTRSLVGDGVLSGSGRVNGRIVCAWAQDGSFKGGSLGTRGGETIARAIAHADKVGAPVVGFPHSGGARLQEGVAALHAYSAIFRAQALATVPQISVIGGPCAGGAAYSPALGDLTVMAGHDAKMFLTGPAVVERVTREQVTALELGGPKVHGRNGVAHLFAEHDVHAAEMVRAALAHLPSQAGGPLPLYPPEDPADGDPGEILPESERAVYDVREVAARIIDGGEFVDLCDRFGLPLVVLVDTPGFLPGVSQEQAGVIRHGASLLRAFSVAPTPRITVTLRAAYGGAHIVMNSRDLGADLTMAWPHAKIGVMGPRQAVEVVNRREIAAGADAQALADEYAAEHLPVRVAASRGFIDEVVAPSETRERIAFALEAAR